MINISITGLNKLSRQLEDAQKALAALDGELGSVSFDPNDPASIESAIKSVERLIDDRVGLYDDNPFVAPFIDGMKEQYRAGIIEKAAAARLKDGGS